jgi:hypothetical protein
MLRKRDAGTGKIKFVDIASDSYDPSENAGIDFEAAMGRIHGIQRDGTIVTNVEVYAPFLPLSGLASKCGLFVWMSPRVSYLVNAVLPTLDIPKWESCAAETSN